MKRSDLENLVMEVIEETIRKQGGKYVVYPKHGGKRLGTHDSRKAALRQLAAIEASKHSLKELTIDQQRFWAYYADIFDALKKVPAIYYKLKEKLTGEKLDALEFFWNTYFKDGKLVMREDINFVSLEKKLDDMFDELDIDINFTNHFKERVLERGLTEDDIIELAKKIIAQYPDELDYLKKDQNVVLTHLSRLVDIAAVSGGYGPDYLKDLIFKTAYKRQSAAEPEFRTNATAPKLKVAETKSVHDPVRPGILKNQIKGKVTCSKAAALKAKQKDKSNNTAKAAQRFINYHCN